MAFDKEALKPKYLLQVGKQEKAKRYGSLKNEHVANLDRTSPILYPA